MAIKLGSTDINSVNLGSVGLNRIYSGSDFVFGSGFDFRNGLQFDGINDRVAIEDGELIFSRASGLSYSFWVYFPEETTAFPTITSSNGSNIGLLFFATDYIGFYPNGYNTRCFFDYGYNGNRSKKIHIALTVTSSGDVTCRVDSVLVVKTTSNTCPTSVRMAGIGKFNTSLTNGAFKIDEFAIYEGKTLTQQEVNTLYNSGNGNNATSVGVPTFYWKFNESGATTIVPSAVIGGRNGVLENFTGDYWVPF